MRGIVYDQDPTEIYVFVSDIEPIDYQKLQDVLTIQIGSLTPLAKEKEQS